VPIAEKSFVNDVADTDGTVAELLELLALLEGEPLLLQAARSRAAPPATAVRPALLVAEYKQTTSLLGEMRQDAPNDRLHDGHCGQTPIWENSKPTGINGAVNIHVTM
jgi:hypothetical protein